MIDILVYFICDNGNVLVYFLSGNLIWLHSRVNWQGNKGRSWMENGLLELEGACIYVLASRDQK